jgi:hypothetical protein
MPPVDLHGSFGLRVINLGGVGCATKEIAHAVCRRRYKFAKRFFHGDSSAYVGVSNQQDCLMRVADR